MGGGAGTSQRGQLGDRADGREATGQRVLGAGGDLRAVQRARVGEQFVQRPVGGGVAVRDGVRRGRVRHERDVVAQVGGHPGGGLAALLGADAGHRDRAHPVPGEQLLQVRRGEGVVRGLGQQRVVGLVGQAEPFSADLASAEQPESLVAAVLDRFGRIDVLAPDQVVPTPGTLFHKLTGTDDPDAEPPEVMAEAALALCTRPPEELTGRIAYSQELLAELDR